MAEIKTTVEETYSKELNQSVSDIDWEHARRVMLTEDSQKTSLSGCLFERVKHYQTKTIQQCITNIANGLKLANLFGITGGYAGNRDYSNIFLIDDRHLLGLFDNRNVSKASTVDATELTTLEELLDQYQEGIGNNRTLIVFEKDNLRIANSYAKRRQSRFMIDVIYPALLGIIEWAIQICPEKFEYRCSENADHFLSDLLQNPKSVDSRLIETSPLWFIRSPHSPFNTKRLRIKKGEAIHLNTPNKVLSSREYLEYILKSIDLFIGKGYGPS